MTDYMSTETPAVVERDKRHHVHPYQVFESFSKA